MNYKLKIVVFLFTISFITIQLNSEAVLIKTEQESDGLEIDVNLSTPPDIKKEIIETHTFNRLIIPEMGIIGSVGEPELPVWRRYIEVPLNAQSVSMEYESLGASEEIKLDYPLYPIQPPWEKILGKEKPKLTMNDAAYQSGKKFGEKVVEIEPFGVVRNKRLYQISYFPVCYDPTNSKIYITGKILVHVYWQIEKSNSSRDKKYSSKYIDDLWKPYILNDLSALDKSKIARYNIPTGMIVIVGSPFIGNSKLNEWIEWKTQRGFVVTTVSVADIGLSTVSIKQYIKQAYLNWDIPPSFVVLVGDLNTLPAFQGTAYSNPITDLYYSTVDGDEYYTPDLWVGRISVSDSANLNNSLNKILKYEKAQWTLTEPWYIKASFLASTDKYSVTEGTHNYVISNYFEPAGFNSQKLYTVTYSATTSDVINAINEGRGWIVYSGHGSDSSWADGPPLSQTQVSNLTNTVYPWVLSFACETGQYGRPECFGETWQRASSGGVGFLGSSVTSYWDQDDILEKRIMESFFTSNKTWTAGMILEGKLKFFNYYGNGDTTKRYFEMYNLLGDPSTEIWAGLIQNPTITHGISVSPDGLPFPVYIGWENASIAISSSTTLLGASLSQFGNNIINTSPPGTVSTVKLTVTGNPIFPYQVDLPVIANSTGNILWDKTLYNGSSLATLTLTDSDLSGQGVILVPVYSSGGDMEQVSLTETEIMGLFKGTIQLTTSVTENNDGLLSVVHNGTITAEYYDEYTESGTSQTITVEATTDIYPPQLLQLSVVPAILSVNVQLVSDENCLARFEYGQECVTPFPGNDTSFTTDTNHTFSITGLSQDTEYSYRIILTDLAGNEYVSDCMLFKTLVRPDFFTYYYTSNLVDTVPLSNHRILFTPEDSPDYYSACIEPASVFLRNTEFSTPISISDDDYFQIDFPLGVRIYFYGTAYSQCYVGSNGYITFTAGDDDYSESTADHFDLPRISLFFDDLNPEAGGSLTYTFDWNALVITYFQIPRYGSGVVNAQVELFYDGRIAITWLNCSSSSFIAGLSRGTGTPEQFESSDFLNYDVCETIEGSPEGVYEGEYIFYHSSDLNHDGRISLTEILRIVQLYNSLAYCCDITNNSEDGYLPGTGENYECSPHSSDYNPQDWIISLRELLRTIQIFNVGGYYPCPGESEDNFCLNN